MKSNKTSAPVNEIFDTGGVAANMDRHGTNRHGETRWREQASADADRSTMRLGAHEVNRTREQIDRAKAIMKAKKKARFKEYANRLFRRNISEAVFVKYYEIINEDINVNDTVSRMKGLEKKNEPRQGDTTTFGVEDDQGNIMKVTVKSDQAKDFERRLSLELGEIQTDKIYGYQKVEVSMAELLYNLKNEFEIIDVEFPTIPSDAIYNADKATYGEDDTASTAMSQDANMGGDTGMGDEMNGEMGMDTQLPPSDGSELPPEGDEGLDGEMGDDLEGMDEEGLDDDSVEDFTEDQPEGFESMFQGLLQMMTAQAEATKAQAEAEAEKARAMTAEYSAKAAGSVLAREEELARMGAELDKQKQKEKEAKKLSDLAKFRVQQGKTTSGPQFESVFKKVVEENKIVNEELEGETLENEQMIRTALKNAKQQYAPKQGDSPETANYKQQTLAALQQEFDAKAKRLRIARLYNQQIKKTNDNPQNQQQQNQQPNNQQNNQQQQNQQNVNAARNSLNAGQSVKTGTGV